MNHFSAGLDMRALSRIIRVHDKFSFLQFIQTFQIGRTRPSYSTMMLNGVPVNGINAAVKFGKFHAAAVYGKSQRSVQPGVYLAQQYQQDFLFVKAGLGNRDQSIFSISLLHAKDDMNSIIPEQKFYVRQPDTLVYLTDTLFIPLDSTPVFRRPRESLLSGLDFSTWLLASKIKLSAEVVGAMNTGNTNSAKITIDEIPPWAEQIHPLRLTTSISFAAHIRTDINLKKTRFYGAYKIAMPGFYSPGTPFMRQDYRSFECKAYQLLFHNKLTLQPHYRLFRDNLSDQQIPTTLTQIWGVNAVWQPPDLPYFSLTITPHKQKLKDDHHESVNTAFVASLGTGKRYFLLHKWHAFTGFSWSIQQTVTNINNIEQHYTGNQFSMQQNIRMEDPITLNAHFGYYHLLTDNHSTASYHIGCRASYRPVPNWNIGLGLKHLNRNGDQKRTNLMFHTSYQFGIYGEARLTAEPVVYRDILNPDKEYNQYIITVSLINKW